MNNARQPSSPPRIFDRALLRLRQQRARRQFSEHAFLHRIIIEEFVDRLETVTRQFPLALVSGPGALLLRPSVTEKCGIENLIEADTFEPLSGGTGIDLDKEYLPITQNALDLVISMMSLHMVNDLPGALVRIRQSLQPDGLFLAAMPGENTLQELRTSLYQAETEITGGVSPRVIPFAAIRDLGGLMQRAGFALPVADITRLPVTYRDPMRLLYDLRYMAETNVLYDRKKGTLRRDILSRMLEIYQERFPAADEKGVTASFEIIMLTGWAPHPDQQKPLRPGSARASLEEAIKNQAGA